MFSQFGAIREIYFQERVQSTQYRGTKHNLIWLLHNTRMEGETRNTTEHMYSCVPSLFRALSKAY
jgi:hypothetical protein